MRVHLAVFDTSQDPCFFVNVTNLSRDREIEITHVWFDCGSQVPVIREERPLPKRLKPDEAWETWLHRSEIPGDRLGDAGELARVRLSTGAIIKSKPSASVPARGHVPGDQRGA